VITALRKAWKAGLASGEKHDQGVTSWTSVYRRTSHKKGSNVGATGGKGGRDTTETNEKSTEWTES